MKKKIKATNYDGTIIEVEVNINVYNYDKENYWQEDWRNRKAKQQDSYEEMCNFYQKMDCLLNYRKSPVSLNT